jgi:hypothetical protein
LCCSWRGGHKHGHNQRAFLHSAALVFIAGYPVQCNRAVFVPKRLVPLCVIANQMIQIKDSGLFVVIDIRHGVEIHRHRAI